MIDAVLIKLISIFVGLFFAFYPLLVQAVEITSFTKEMKSVQTVELPKQMTQEEINNLFGEDPYLGQTSYLQSPDGFSQRKKSK
tara:strand:+ start:4671 stop:4922 length:252 start_codon:yes stop_codon:yes gene_type:complete